MSGPSPHPNMEVPNGEQATLTHYDILLIKQVLEKGFQHTLYVGHEYDIVLRLYNKISRLLADIKQLQKKETT